MVLPRASKSSTRILGTAGLLLGALFALGCKSAEKAPAETEPKPTPTVEAGPSEIRIAGSEQKHLLAERASDCSIIKQGFVVDLAALEPRTARGRSDEGAEVVTRAGRALRRLKETAEFEFWLPEAMPRVGATLLVSNAGSDRIALSVDGSRLGAVKVPDGPPRAVQIRTVPMALSRGRHTLSVSLSRKKGAPPGVEIGWVRLAAEDLGGASEEPLGANEIEDELTFGEARRQAFVLREGMALRCPVWIADPKARITTEAAMWGSGDGEVQMILRRDGESARLLAERTFERGDKPGWTPIDSGALGVSGEFVEIELRAIRAGKGSRLALSRPMVEAEPVAEAVAKRAARAFVFVLGGLSSLHEPVSAAANGLPVMSELAGEAVSYPSYRTTTTSARGVLASLMTGAPPWIHRLIENEDRLDQTLSTLAEQLSAASGRAAFFTAVPTTFSAFGLGRGFERTEEVSPTEDRPADEPLTLFSKWLSERSSQKGPLFAVVHLRGAHPPFDISREAAQLLPPPEYGGELEPRRAAIQLAHIRARRHRGDRVMPEDDWARLLAMSNAALRDHNRALRETFAALRRQGLWDDSLIVLMGDVGSGLRPNIPFSEEAPLDPEYLSVPLLIKYPQSEFGGTQVKGLYGPEDVHATIAALLGQKPSDDGLVLLPSARPDLLARSRAHVAVRRGRYATILGPYRLTGEEGKEPRLCRRDWDPACSQPREKVDPLAATLLWNWTRSALARGDGRPRPRSLEPLETRVQNALFVWGAGPI